MMVVKIMVAFVVVIKGEKMGGEDASVDVDGEDVGAGVGNVGVDFGLVDSENIAGDVDDDGKTALW